MFLVTERIDGLNHVTPFWCEVKATILKDKIVAAGGSAEVSKI